MEIETKIKEKINFPHIKLWLDLVKDEVGLSCFTSLRRLIQESAQIDWNDSQLVIPYSW